MAEKVVCPVCARYVALYRSGSIARHNKPKYSDHGVLIPGVACRASNQTYSWIRQQVKQGDIPT